MARPSAAHATVPSGAARPHAATPSAAEPHAVQPSVGRPHIFPSPEFVSSEQQLVDLEFLESITFPHEHDHDYIHQKISRLNFNLSYSLKKWPLTHALIYLIYLCMVQNESEHLLLATNR